MTALGFVFLAVYLVAIASAASAVAFALAWTRERRRFAAAESEVRTLRKILRTFRGNGEVTARKLATVTPIRRDGR